MKIIFSMMCLVLTAVLLSTACAGGSMEAEIDSGNSEITEGVMTTSVDDESKPTGGTQTTFPVDTPAIYCSFKVSGVEREDMIKATWIYVNGEAKDKANTQINETYDIVQVSEASYYLAFYLDKPVEGWVRGYYEVVLSINNQEKLSVPFKIE